MEMTSYLLIDCPFPIKKLYHPVKKLQRWYNLSNIYYPESTVLFAAQLFIYADACLLGFNSFAYYSDEVLCDLYLVWSYNT